jgi:UDP-glucose 4-epimerase
MRIKDARQNFLGIWMRRVVENGVFEVWGGQQKRDLTFIADAVDAFLAAASCPIPEHRIFNLGGSAIVTLADLGNLLVEVAGTGQFEIKPFPAERLRIDLGDYYTDDTLFRKTTGWQPKVSLRDALASTVAYYREHMSHYV